MVPTLQSLTTVAETVLTAGSELVLSLEVRSGVSGAGTSGSDYNGDVVRPTGCELGKPVIVPPLGKGGRNQG